MLRAFARTCIATLLYAAVHSFFASDWAKRGTASLVGVRIRNALYRPFYLAQSATTMVILVSYIRRQPSRVLFELEGGAAAALRSLQAAGLCWAVAAAYEVRFTEILGIRPLAALLRRAAVIAPEPEAQRPPFDGRKMRVYGPFRWARHPLNFAPLPIFWFNPRMTTNLLAFNLVSTAYLVIGSAHEEIRLFNRYGRPYRAYQRSGVNFYLPGPSRL
jgi:protein-S-isoprenylcysteine O-methyltransferase Ste14